MCLSDPAWELLAWSKRRPSSVILEPPKGELWHQRQGEFRAPDLPKLLQRSTGAVAVKVQHSVHAQRHWEVDSMRRHFDPGSAAPVSSLACETATKWVQSACVAVSIAWSAALEPA